MSVIESVVMAYSAHDPLALRPIEGQMVSSHSLETTKCHELSVGAKARRFVSESDTEVEKCHEMSVGAKARRFVSESDTEIEIETMAGVLACQDFDDAVKCADEGLVIAQESLATIASLSERGTPTVLGMAKSLVKSCTDRTLASRGSVNAPVGDKASESSGGPVDVSGKKSDLPGVTSKAPPSGGVSGSMDPGVKVGDKSVQALKKQRVADKFVYCWVSKFGGCQPPFRCVKMELNAMRTDVSQDHPFVSLPALVQSFMRTLRESATSHESERSGLDVAVVAEAMWSPMQVVRVLVPNPSGPYFNQSVALVNTREYTAGDLSSCCHWNPVGSDQSYLISGVDSCEAIHTGLNNLEIDNSLDVPRTQSGHVFMVCAHPPAYRKFFIKNFMQRGITFGFPMFLNNEDMLSFFSTCPASDCLLVTSAVGHSASRVAWESNLVDGELVASTTVSSVPRQVQIERESPPWEIEVPSGPLPLGDWIQVSWFASGPSASKEGVNAFIAAAVGVSGEFRKRGWQRYVRDLKEPQCRPKLGALSWKLSHMRETNVTFDSAEINAYGGGGFSPLSTHASFAYHGFQEAVIGPMFGLGSVVRGSGGYKNPWNAVETEDGYVYGAFGTPDWWSSLSYAPVSGAVESFAWGTELQFAVRLRVDRCKVLPASYAPTDRTVAYYMFKEHWVKLDEFFVGVRAAMPPESGRGHIITQEERLITIELPTLSRPVQEFPFQKNWKKRPMGVIPVLDESRILYNAVFASVDPGGPVLVQPQYIHPRGNYKLNALRSAYIEKRPLCVGTVPEHEGFGGHEGVPALFNMLEVKHAMKALYPDATESDVMECWASMRDASVNSVVQWASEIASVDGQELMMEEQQKVLARYVKHFVDSHPTRAYWEAKSCAVNLGEPVLATRVIAWGKEAKDAQAAKEASSSAATESVGACVPPASMNDPMVQRLSNPPAEPVSDLGTKINEQLKKQRDEAMAAAESGPESQRKDALRKAQGMSGGDVKPEVLHAAPGGSSNDPLNVFGVPTATASENVEEQEPLVPRQPPVIEERRLLRVENGGDDNIYTWRQVSAWFTEKYGDRKGMTTAASVWTRSQNDVVRPTVKDGEEPTAEGDRDPIQRRGKWQPPSVPVREEDVQEEPWRGRVARAGFAERDPSRKRDQSRPPPRDQSQGPRSRSKPYITVLDMDTALGAKDDNRPLHTRERDERVPWGCQIRDFLVCNQIDDECKDAVLNLSHEEQKCLVAWGHIVNHKTPSAELWTRHRQMKSGDKPPLDMSVYVACGWCGVGTPKRTAYLGCVGCARRPPPVDV